MTLYSFSPSKSSFHHTHWTHQILWGTEIPNWRYDSTIITDEDDFIPHAAFMWNRATRYSNQWHTARRAISRSSYPRKYLSNGVDIYISDSSYARYPIFVDEFFDGD